MAVIAAPTTQKLAKISQDPSVRRTSRMVAIAAPESTAAAQPTSCQVPKPSVPRKRRPVQLFARKRMRVAAMAQAAMPITNRTQATSAPGSREVARLANADITAKNTAELIMTSAADGRREDSFIEGQASLA